MKKLFVIVAVVLFSAAIVDAKETTSNMNEEAISVSTAVNVPTGNYWNGTNFIKIESSWLRIVIQGQQMREFDFYAERDPHGNYVLRFGNGECITIYSNGRSLYYNGTTYSKK